MSSVFSIKPTIRGESVILRPVVPEDIPALGRVLRDPEAQRLTGKISRTGEDGLRLDDDELLELYEEWAKDEYRLILVVEDRASGEVVGQALLNDLEKVNMSCSFRILLGPAGRDRGLGTEATRLLMDYAFEEAGLHRVSLEVYAFNPRARHVYEKLGFVHEGVSRETLVFDGEWIDADRMSLLAHEHPRG